MIFQFQTKFDQMGLDSGYGSGVRPESRIKQSNEELQKTEDIEQHKQPELPPKPLRDTGPAVNSSPEKGV
jgi:hypothetical protein